MVDCLGPEPRRLIDYSKERAVVGERSPRRQSNGIHTVRLCSEAPVLEDYNQDPSCESETDYDLLDDDEEELMFYVRRYASLEVQEDQSQSEEGETDQGECNEVLSDSEHSTEELASYIPGANKINFNGSNSSGFRRKRQNHEDSCSSLGQSQISQLTDSDFETMTPKSVKKSCFEDSHTSKTSILSPMSMSLSSRSRSRSRSRRAAAKLNGKVNLDDYFQKEKFKEKLERSGSFRSERRKSIHRSSNLAASDTSLNSSFVNHEKSKRRSSICSTSQAEKEDLDMSVSSLVSLEQSLSASQHRRSSLTMMTPMSPDDVTRGLRSFGSSDGGAAILKMMQQNMQINDDDDDDDEDDGGAKDAIALENMQAELRSARRSAKLMSPGENETSEATRGGLRRWHSDNPTPVKTVASQVLESLQGMDEEDFLASQSPMSKSSNNTFGSFKGNALIDISESSSSSNDTRLDNVLGSPLRSSAPSLTNVLAQEALGTVTTEEQLADVTSLGKIHATTRAETQDDISDSDSIDITKKLEIEPLDVSESDVEDPADENPAHDDVSDKEDPGDENHSISSFGSNPVGEMCIGPNEKSQPGDKEELSENAILLVNSSSYLTPASPKYYSPKAGSTIVPGKPFRAANREPRPMCKIPENFVATRIMRRHQKLINATLMARSEHVLGKNSSFPVESNSQRSTRSHWSFASEFNAERIEL